MPTFSCKKCGKEINIGFFGKYNAVYGYPYCKKCFTEFDDEESKPVTTQKEEHLNRKLRLAKARREKIYKHATSLGNVLFGGGPSSLSPAISKLDGDIQMIQLELQRRANLSPTTIIKEHVRLYCRFCGALHDQMDLKCPNCGASTK